MHMHFSFSFFSCLAFRHTLISQKIVFPGALPLLYECCPTVGMTGCFGDLLIWQSQTLLLFILNFILALSTVNSLECWLKSCFLLEKAWSCPLVGALLVFPLRLHPLPCCSNRWSVSSRSHSSNIQGEVQTRLLFMYQKEQLCPWHLSR